MCEEQELEEKSERTNVVQRDLEDQIEEEYISRGQVYQRTEIKQIMTPITTSGVLTDLKNGYTRLKKDDRGFGSIEEKYGLTVDEVKELFQTPSLKAKKTAVPKRKLEIIDDLPAPQVSVGQIGVFPDPDIAQPAPLTLDSVSAYIQTMAPEAMPVAADIVAEANKLHNTNDSIFA